MRNRLKWSQVSKNSQNWRKHYVVLHKRNQGKCTDMSRTRCRSRREEFKSWKTCPIKWGSAINNRQTIQTLQSGRRSFQLHWWTVIPKLLRRNWWHQKLPNPYTKPMVDLVLRSLQGDFGNHPWTTETTIAYRHKYYYRNMAQLTRQWVFSCEHRIRESWVQWQTQTTGPAESEWTHHSTKLCHANWFGSLFTSFSWLWELSDSRGCVVKISICLPYFQPRCENYRKIHLEHND